MKKIANKGLKGCVYIMSNGAEIFIINVFPRTGATNRNQTGFCVGDSYYLDTVQELYFYKEYGLANNEDIVHMLNLMLKEVYLYGDVVELERVFESGHKIKTKKGVNNCHFKTNRFKLKIAEPGRLDEINVELIAEYLPQLNKFIEI